MLAALYAGDQTFRLEQHQARLPGPGEVRLDVAYVGICGTDLHIKHGAMDRRVTIPAVIGHEMSGTVAAVGEGVRGWSRGPSARLPQSGLRWYRLGRCDAAELDGTGALAGGLAAWPRARCRCAGRAGRGRGT